MKYRLLHNLDARFGRAGNSKDRYVEGYEGNIPIRLDGREVSLEKTLDKIFARHNMDNRPDGKVRPSLSVGDVIVLGGHKAWTVDMVGFVPVDHPTQILADYPD